MTWNSLSAGYLYLSRAITVGLPILVAVIHVQRTTALRRHKNVFPSARRHASRSVRMEFCPGYEKWNNCGPWRLNVDHRTGDQDSQQRSFRQPPRSGCMLGMSKNCAYQTCPSKTCRLAVPVMSMRMAGHNHESRRGAGLMLRAQEPQDKLRSLSNQLCRTAPQGWNRRPSGVSAPLSVSRNGDSLGLLPGNRR